MGYYNIVLRHENYVRLQLPFNSGAPSRGYNSASDDSSRMKLTQVGPAVHNANRYPPINYIPSGNPVSGLRLHQLLDRPLLVLRMRNSI